MATPAGAMPEATFEVEETVIWPAAALATAKTTETGSRLRTTMRLL